MNSGCSVVKQQIVDKPWGSEKIWAKTDKYAAKLLHIEPNQRLSKQYHKTKDETIFVLSGTLTVLTNQHEVVTEVREGESFRIVPSLIHRFCADEFGCILIEVSTPELDDVVRLEDDYGRQLDV